MKEHDRRGFYHRLESHPNASAESLKKNYRRLALAHHPDREPDPGLKDDCQERMRSLNEAYDMLRDPTRRAAYDRDCDFPRCRRHPHVFVEGHCRRCREPICPECAGGNGDSCRTCQERFHRRRTATDPVERALLDLEDGELQAAEQELVAALLKNPRDVVALTALSTVREKQTDWAGAIETLKLALEIKPGHALSHYRLGMLYLRAGNRPLAEHCLREALQLSPANGKYRAALSQLQSSETGSIENPYRPHDRVAHQVFGSGVVTEVTPSGVKVEFLEAGSRWLDPRRAPLVRVAHH